MQFNRVKSAIPVANTIPQVQSSHFCYVCAVTFKIIFSKIHRWLHLTNFFSELTNITYKYADDSTNIDICNLLLYFLLKTSLTLIQLTPYHLSYQPTWLPFPSAQCVYHFWIRSAGNVGISFLLLGGGAGVAVYTVFCTRSKGGEQGLNLDKNMRFFTLF